MRSYRVVFNRQALNFAADASEEVFAEIGQWVDRIRRTPFAAGDYVEEDGDRREVQLAVLRHVAIAYWPDHALREVRVTRIEPVKG